MKVACFLYRRNVLEIDGFEFLCGVEYLISVTAYKA